jgi:hypothetical protein
LVSFKLQPREGSNMTKSSTKAPGRVLAACAAFVFVSSFASATIWIVDANNGPGTHFTTITAAIAAAQPGDRILVRAGNYIETVNVNKAVTIVGWNATRYPMVVPANPFATAIWGGLGVTGIPAGHQCVVSGLVIARPTLASGASIGVLNSQGAVVLDRLIAPNGGVHIENSTNVIIEGLRVRHSYGALPPIDGVVVINSWVQASDLDATGCDLTTDPDYHPSAGCALNVQMGSVVALARPRLIGGFGGGPWVNAPSTPTGGAAIRCTMSVVAIVDQPGNGSYITGGQGGHRGTGSALSVSSGNGGNAVEAELSGYILNKLPMPIVPGTAGPNNAGGPTGFPGTASFTTSGGLYAPIVDVPSLYRNIGDSVPGGVWIFNHRAAAANIPVAMAVMQDFGLNLYAPSVQFAAGNPFTAVALNLGMSNAVGVFEFGFGLPFYPESVVGTALVVQTADDVANTLFLSNPGVFVFGF